MKIADPLLGAYGVYRSRINHTAEFSHNLENFDEALKLARYHHAVDISNTQKTYLLELYYSLKQHFQQLNADLISSGRESERDMFDQRNQIMQTIILASSVMFSTLSNVIVQGSIPQKAPSEVFVSFAFFFSISFVFLFVAIIISLEVIRRSSEYMYKSSKNHSMRLEKTLTDKEKWLKFRVEGIAAMPYDKAENAWISHEKNLRDYLDHRENINIKAAAQLSLRENGGDSFEQFWREKCSLLSTAAMTCFFCGTITLLVAILIFMWATYSITYNNVPAAIIAVGIIIVSILVSVFAWIKFRMTDMDDYSDNKQDGEREEEGEANKQEAGEEEVKEEAKFSILEEALGRVVGFHPIVKQEAPPIFCAPASSEYEV